jgi:hypothetical protein
VWDKKVRSITGGLTILNPVKGQWIASSGTLYAERVIPVRVSATKEQMEEIANFTAKHYEQLAIMFYKLSDEVTIAYFDDKKFTRIKNATK